MSLEKGIERYLEQNNIWHFNGDRGIEALNKLIKIIGYDEDGFRYGSSLERFLGDNPGAIEALLSWIGSQHCPDWEENLNAVTLPDEEELEEDTQED